MCSAGVAWSADTKRRLLEHLPGVTLLDACGSTEGGTYGMSAVRLGDDLSTTRFTRAPGTIIVDDDGQLLADGEIGAHSRGDTHLGLLQAPAQDG